MTNPFFLQLIGILLAAAGFAALTAAGYSYGKPLSRDERQRKGLSDSNWYSLPINLATIAAAAFVFVGLGILARTHFNLCSFINYWLPQIPYGIKFFLSCR